MRRQILACEPVNLSQFVVDLKTRHLSYWNLFTTPDPRLSNSMRLTYHQWCALPVRAAHAIHLILCLNTCVWIFPIMSFATFPDSSCEFTLFELSRLFGPIVLLQSVISVNLMTYKMENMCCSDVPILRSALSARSMPHFLSTTSLFYISTSPTECPV
eukprot:1154046-Pelagomonas_calceolata.AAC.1